MSSSGILALLIVCFCTSGRLWATATQVTYDNRAIIIDGKHRVLVSGSIHYPRSTTQAIFYILILIVFQHVNNLHDSDKHLAYVYILIYIYVDVAGFDEEIKGRWARCH